MKNKIMEYYNKLKKEEKVRYILVIVGLIIIVATISIFLGIEYIIVFVIFALLRLLSRQGMDEKEEMITIRDKEKAHLEIEELREKEKVLKQHIEETNDVEAKIKLLELQKEMDSIKEKYKI